MRPRLDALTRTVVAGNVLFLAVVVDLIVQRLRFDWVATVYGF